MVLGVEFPIGLDSIAKPERDPRRVEGRQRYFDTPQGLRLPPYPLYRQAKTGRKRETRLMVNPDLTVDLAPGLPPRSSSSEPEPSSDSRMPSEPPC